MLRRYELTDEEWNRIASLLPPENSRKQGRPQKCSRTILNGIVWIARSGAPWRDLPERYGSWQTVYSRFRKWIELADFGAGVFAGCAFADLNETVQGDAVPLIFVFGDL